MLSCQLVQLGVMFSFGTWVLVKGFRRRVLMSGSLMRVQKNCRFAYHPFDIFSYCLGRSALMLLNSWTGIFER